MPEWDEFLRSAVESLDYAILRDPEYLLTRPGYGAPVEARARGSVCVHRLIGLDEQHDGDIVRDHFLGEWLVPMRPTRRMMVADSSPDQKSIPLDPIRTVAYRPLNIYACMTVSLMSMFPPDWVKVGKDQRFTIWLVRYVRTT